MPTMRHISRHGNGRNYHSRRRGCMVRDAHRNHTKTMAHINIANDVQRYVLRRRRCKGTWCSGITSASHAEGPGFKSQCVHICVRLR